MIPKIAISLGDPNGIGPEVALKTVGLSDLQASIPVLAGSRPTLDLYRERLPDDIPLLDYHSGSELSAGSIYFYEVDGSSDFHPDPGTLSAASGAISMRSVEAAAELCLKNRCDAVVTSPISKEAIQLAGYAFPGHTEFLAEKTGEENVVMMLVSSVFRVALATIHIPVRRIADSISIQSIITNTRIVHQSLQTDFGIANPRIGVLGLNPHAGDGGYIGREEIDIIKPALMELRKESIQVEGPFPADAYFANQRQKKYHATFAMYHDQGLIPFKALSFGKGVNYTAGLPIIRTSPDHGTAFDIAGKMIADYSSFREAYNLAVTMALNRANKRMDV
jgi:4-hydroxythreonine-4-phosphate dehydrogenase